MDSLESDNSSDFFPFEEDPRQLPAYFLSSMRKPTTTHNIFIRHACAGWHDKVGATWVNKTGQEDVLAMPTRRPIDNNAVCVIVLSYYYNTTKEHCFE